MLVVRLFASAAVAAEEEEAHKPEAEEEIIVTGSRIRRKDLTTPAPVTVITRDQVSASGRVSLGEFLQALPEQGNSGANAQVNNGNDGSIYMSLRSLEPQRTLVLLNGRRMVPGGTGANPAVDIGTIPAAAIGRIEVLKDGASAIYGSDAIAGVVNIILRKRYVGTEVSAYGGISQRGDGNTYDVHGMTGTAGEHGSLLLSLAYQEHRPVYSGDRDYSKTTYNWNYGNGCFADPITGVCVPKGLSGTGNSSTFPNGRFTIPSSACGSTDGAGTFRPNPSVATHPALASICAATGNKGGGFMADAPRDGLGAGPASGYIAYPGDAYNTNPTNYLITPARRIQVFSTGDVNLGTSARAFFEASYVNRTSAQSLAPMPLVNNTIATRPVTVSSDSMYNPFGVNITSWGIRTAGFGERRWSQDLDTFRIVAGFDGTLGEWSRPLAGWVWNVDYNHGRTAGDQLEVGQLRMPNVANAVGPSATDPATGRPVCLKTRTGTAADFAAGNIIAGCVPFDVLHGSYSGQSAAKNYLSYDGTDFGANQQDIWSASLSGALFKLASERPAGLAIGFDYRRESASFQNNPINGNFESSGNNQESTSGGYTAKDAYAELVIPMLGGLPFAEDLEIQGAFRWNHYSSFGGQATYKLGLRYSPIRDVTARATWGTAYRAPNVAELYGGNQFYFSGPISDPCNNPTDPVVRQRCIDAGVPGGNSHDPSRRFVATYAPAADLGPESSTTFTAGVVLQPRPIRGLTLVVDYFDTNISRAITFIEPAEGGVILPQCYLAPVQDPAMCDLIVRAQGGAIVQINNKRANAASFHTTGVDFAVRYSVALEDVGRLGLILDGTWLLGYRRSDFAGHVIQGVGNYDLGVLPRLKFNTAVMWSAGPLSAGILGRYIGSYKECAKLCSVDDSQQHTIPHYLPVDAFVSYSLRGWAAGTTAATLGVQNVADLQPPYMATASAVNSDPSTYDFIGRFFYLRLTHTF